MIIQDFLQQGADRALLLGARAGPSFGGSCWLPAMISLIIMVLHHPSGIVFYLCAGSTQAPRKLHPFTLDNGSQVEPGSRSI